MNPDENSKILNKILLDGEVSGTLKSVVLDNEFTINDFITILFYLGYITIKDKKMFTTFEIPNYVSEVIYSHYFADMISENEKYNINLEKIQNATMDLGENGKLNKTVDLIKDFLVNSSNRNTENFSEKDLKFLFMVFLEFSTAYKVYDEYQAGQGFVDLYIQNNTNRSIYEAVVELKYVKKSDIQKVNKEKLVENAKTQLLKYMEDNRLNSKENLKKYVIIFLGFNDYILKEI